MHGSVSSQKQRKGGACRFGQSHKDENNVEIVGESEEIEDCDGEGQDDLSHGVSVASHKGMRERTDPKPSTSRFSRQEDESKRRRQPSP